MRQTPQSTVRTPLNRILATETHVRILRALTRSDQPLSAADLAESAQRQIAGVRRASADLVDTGIVEPMGAQRNRLYRLRDAHPLARGLRSLFREESDRLPRMVAAIGEAARQLDPPPIAVWMQGPAVTGTDREEHHLVIGLLAGATEIDRLADRLREELGEVETTEDVTIEIRAFTRADLLTLAPGEHEELANTAPIVGLPPSMLNDTRRKLPPRRPPARSHAELDARSIAIASLIAEKLARDPALIGRAQRWVANRMLRASPQESRELQEWEHVLRTTSLPRLQRLLVDRGPWATRLRQTLPFAEVLTPAERDRILGGSGT